MAIYLSLGSNRGSRRENLRAALAALADGPVTIDRLSPVVETAALLPADAPPDWNSPFLNLVVECRSALQPRELLDRIKGIERTLGRSDQRHWAPRPIDIDILLFDGLSIAADDLTIPHPQLKKRDFVLSPLAALSPGLDLSAANESSGAMTALAASRALDRTIPLWMGIVNLTPDSFSDGGQNASWNAVEARIDSMAAAGAQLLDFGAESTRPGATALTASEEWSRLEPVLERVIEKYGGDALAPKLSIDTYHADVALKALEAGIDIINDVSGLTQPEMIELAANRDAEFVAMHNLGLPADPQRTLATDSSAVDQVEAWLEQQLGVWQKNRIDLNRIVFDPGIGFGKNPLQSLELLRGIDRFKRYGLRILVGHSRKSFMRELAGDSRRQRDLVTIGASMALCQSGVEILRVHNVPDHVTAYQGFSHLKSAD